MTKDFPQYLNDFTDKVERMASRALDAFVLNCEMKKILLAWLNRGNLSDMEMQELVRKTHAAVELK